VKKQRNKPIRLKPGPFYVFKSRPLNYPAFDDVVISVAKNQHW